MDSSTTLNSSVPLAIMSPELAGGNTATTKDTPEAITKAASQFEALLIGELLKSSRESEGGGGWFGSEEESDSGLSSLAEQQLAQNLANSGGLGLSKMVAAGLSKSAAGVKAKG